MSVCSTAPVSPPATLRPLATANLLPLAPAPASFCRFSAPKNIQVAVMVRKVQPADFTSTWKHALEQDG